MFAIGVGVSSLGFAFHAEMNKVDIVIDGDWNQLGKLLMEASHALRAYSGLADEALLANVRSVGILRDVMARKVNA